MENFIIKLFSCTGPQWEETGSACFEKGAEVTWCQIFVYGLKPDDRYFVFYIIQDSLNENSAAEAGMASVDRAGYLAYTESFNNLMLNGCLYEDMEIAAVILIEENDRRMEAPIVGFKQEIIAWRPLVQKYMTALDDNCNTDHVEYSQNQAYDNIIESLPDSTSFEKRGKICKAVEIDLKQLPLSRAFSNIELPPDARKILFIKMQTGCDFLYFVGLPDQFSSDRRPEYIDNGFKTFLCSRASETANDDCDGVWGTYL